MPSPFLASQLRLDPSRVRKLQLRLANAGMTVSRLGRGGGAVLARKAKDITLSDVYQALEGERNDEGRIHPLQRAIVDVLDERLSGALSTITIADLARHARLSVSLSVSRMRRAQRAP